MSNPDNPTKPQTGITKVITAPFVWLKKYRLFLITLLLLVALGACGFLYWQYRSAAQQLVAANNPNADQEAAQLIDELKTVMFLPNEQPTIATVTDKAALGSQEFFAQAENGDKVIIFAEAKKAILYRPSQKKIVNVAPLITESPTDNSASEINNQTQPTISVALLNGSTQVGVTNVIDDQLVAAFPQIEVVSKQTAQKNEYQGKLVVDITGKNSALAQQVAQAIQGTVGSLPEGENQPSTDLLVIVGNSN